MPRPCFHLPAGQQHISCMHLLYIGMLIYLETKIQWHTGKHDFWRATNLLAVIWIKKHLINVIIDQAGLLNKHRIAHWLYERQDKVTKQQHAEKTMFFLYKVKLVYFVYAY